ncbi:MAG TPA: hypothetical protein VM734_10680 [Kofleriaceae bacterium]|nr:hypothetical protein [Kofleriaceae bacterium]
MAGTRATLAAMKMNLLLATCVSTLALGAGTALAGGSEGAIGVGAEFQFAGFGGVSANYDAGAFHAGGFLGFSDADGDDNTNIALGGRFYYHLHSTSMADFGLGGSVGLGFIGDGNPDNDNGTDMVLEPGFQIRAFLGSNVALSFTGGIAIGLIDASGVAINGQLTGGAGVHYYFY